LRTIEYLNHAIDYIEENITQTLEVEEIAKRALLSKYYFQRVFHAVTGVTVTDYIRNRKLTLAAEELVTTDKSVTEIAMDYGYESTDAFTKAFRRLHGVTPSLMRRGEVQLKSFPRMSLQVHIIGESEMRYRIVWQDAFDMIGIAMEKTSKRESDLKVKKFCEKVWEDGSHHKLNELLGYPIMHMLDGVYYGFQEDGSRRYMLGWRKPENMNAAGYTVLHIPAHQWIVFEHRADMSNPTAIRDLWIRLYTEWMPSSMFEQVEGPCRERYFWEDDSYNNYRCEIWLPVTRK